MNTQHQLYALTSPSLSGSSKEKQSNTSEYFRILNKIINRPNQFTLPQNKIKIKKMINEPFKIPEVINENKRHKLKILTILEEPPLPKLNKIFIETRKQLSQNKKLYRDIEEKSLFIENMKYNERIFQQKSIIEDYICPNKKPIINLNSIKSYKKPTAQNTVSSVEEKKELVLPKIQNNKEKIFQTEINEFPRNIELNNSKDIVHEKGHLNE